MKCCPTHKLNHSKLLTRAAASNTVQRPSRLTVFTSTVVSGPNLSLSIVSRSSGSLTTKIKSQYKNTTWVMMKARRDRAKDKAATTGVGALALEPFSDSIDMSVYLISCGQLWVPGFCCNWGVSWSSCLRCFYSDGENCARLDTKRHVCPSKRRNGLVLAFQSGACNDCSLYVVTIRLHPMTCIISAPRPSQNKRRFIWTENKNHRLSVECLVWVSSLMHEWVETEQWAGQAAWTDRTAAARKCGRCICWQAAVLTAVSLSCLSAVSLSAVSLWSVIFYSPY